jgi:hypothetical protein
MSTRLSDYVEFVPYAGGYYTSHGYFKSNSEVMHPSPTRAEENHNIIPESKDKTQEAHYLLVYFLFVIIYLVVPDLGVSPHVQWYIISLHPLKDETRAL